MCVGKFLFNNYKQARSIIHVYTPELEEFKAVYASVQLILNSGIKKSPSG